MWLYFQLFMYMFTSRHIGVELTIRMVKGIYTYHKDHTVESTVFSPWSKSVIPFLSLRWKIQAFQDGNAKQTTTWNSAMTPQFSAPPKPHWSTRKHTPGKTRTRWSNHNHCFNPIRTNRYNTLDTKPNDMNKLDIVQPSLKRACKCSDGSCTYCKYEAPYPSPEPSDWSSEDWDGEKAKAREQKSLIDFTSPKQDTNQQMTDTTVVKKETVMADDKPFQNWPYNQTIQIKNHQKLWTHCFHHQKHQQRLQQQTQQSQMTVQKLITKCWQNKSWDYRGKKKSMPYTWACWAKKRRVIQKLTQMKPLTLFWLRRINAY